MKTMLIVDGDGLLVRSHYAVGKDIMTKADLEVGGVDKFVHVLRRQIRTWDADAVFIALDPMGPTTVRHKEYKEYKDYKGNREPKPPGLVHSKSILGSIMTAMGAAVHNDDEYEADDLVAAMVHATAGGEWRAVVSSHDKDLLGLTTYDHVIIAPPVQIEPIKREDVFTKMKVRADQIMDYLALLGDEADNIPGVDGCGKGKASALLEKYGTLESIVAAAERGEIANKLGECIRRQGKRAVAFRDLMVLRHHAPILDVAACVIGEPAYNTLLPLLLENNLMALYKEALADSTATGA